VIGRGTLPRDSVAMVTAGAMLVLLAVIGPGADFTGSAAGIPGPDCVSFGTMTIGGGRASRSGEITGKP